MWPDMPSSARFTAVMPASGEMADHLLAIQHRAYAVEAAITGCFAIAPLHESIDEFINAQLHWIAAIVDDEIVGALGWTKLADGTIDIDRVFVDPALHRRGIGRELVAEILSLGRTTIVSTLSNNTPACALYEQLGFTVSGTTEIGIETTTTQFHRHASYRSDILLRDRIVANLQRFDRRSLDAARVAAVAVVLSPVEGIVHYAFSQRAFTLRRGAGQYALPGGGAMDGESRIDAALRETAEELGFTLTHSDVLGLLDDMVTRTDHVITPVVVWSAEPLAFVLDPTEVHDAWHVPVAELDRFDAPRLIPSIDGARDVARMPVRGEWINPPTAAILWQFRDVALHGLDTRVDEVGHPWWTAR